MVTPLGTWPAPLVPRLAPLPFLLPVELWPTPQLEMIPLRGWGGHSANGLERSPSTPAPPISLCVVDSNPVDNYPAGEPEPLPCMGKAPDEHAQN